MKGETPVRAQVGAGRPQGRAKPAASKPNAVVAVAAEAMRE
jgi:hypothetical protein